MSFFCPASGGGGILYALLPPGLLLRVCRS